MSGGFQDAGLKLTHGYFIQLDNRGPAPNQCLLVDGADILFKKWKHLRLDNVMLTKPEQNTIFVAINPVGR